MNCPHCKTPLHRVISTRQKDGDIVRTRECFNGHRFQTVEVVVIPKKLTKRTP